MADRKNSAVAIGTQAKALDGIRAVCRDVEDLLPRQRDFHRPLELPRRDRRQYRIGIDPELAAETAADEGADQPHILDRNFQGGRDDLLPLIEHLVCGVKDQLVALPHRERRVGLHHGVALQGRGVGHVELHRRGRECAREVTHGTIGRCPIALMWNARLIEVSAKCVFSTRTIVFDVDQVGRRPGLLKTFRDHKGNRLAVARHFGPGKHRMRLAVIAGALRGRVAMGEDQDDARRLLRSTRIDRFDFSLSDRRFDHKAVQRVLLHLIGVARAAGDFQSSVDAVERLADDALGIKRIRADG